MQKMRKLLIAAALILPGLAHAQDRAAPSAAERLGGRSTPEATNRLQQAMDAAQTTGTYYAAPNGVDSTSCTQATPCTAQGAFMRCHLDQPQGDVCNIQLADGDYINPGINVFYYRFANFTGNCGNPSSVRLIGTQAVTLAWVQDHAVGIFGCMRFEGFVSGVNGILGRQHVIIDYYSVVFGNMPGGTHVGMNEFSIASCGSSVTIAGNTVVHAGASKLSIINLPCTIVINGVFAIDFFVNTQAWSVVAAQGVVFSGSFNVTGRRCNSDFAIVYRTQAFPGSIDGNC